MKFLDKIKEEVTAKKAVGKTSSGKEVPAYDDERITKLFKLPKYNMNVNVFTAHGNDSGKVLIYLLGREGWTKADYLEAASIYAKESDKAADQWHRLIQKAHKETFKEDYKATDYKVSGIGRDEYPEKYKDKLRKYSTAKSYYKGLEHGMKAAAKLSNRLKNMRAPLEKK